jgi:hypothetical protein
MYGLKYIKLVFLPVVLYECETLPLTLRKEHRVFQNKVLRKISQSKTDEVMGGCQKLSNENLQSFYSSPNIIRVIRSNRMR